VGGETPWHEGCVVVKCVGEANREIAWRRGVNLQNPNIEPAGLNIDGG
jgi:hypothetical protein